MTSSPIARERAGPDDVMTHRIRTTSDGTPSPRGREGARTTVRIAFDTRLPQARWGPLFHVFCLEHPDVRLEWRPTGFPTRGGPLLDGADVGLFLEPPPEPRVRRLTLEVSPMVVVVAVGHRLAGHEELTVAEILDEPFPGSPGLHPEWRSFWTLDRQRGKPATFSGDDVRTAEDALDVVAAGRAIATLPASLAGDLAHPGVVAVALGDGPPVRTCLVWRSEAEDPAIRALVDLADAWTRGRRSSPGSA
jgi:DNA-binding transcriptional LysR family regulator